MANTHATRPARLLSLVPQPTDLLWDEEDPFIDDLQRVLLLLPDGRSPAERPGGHPGRRPRRGAYPPAAETGSFYMQAATPAESNTGDTEADELRRRAAEACRAAALEQRRSVELCDHAAALVARRARSLTNEGRRFLLRVGRSPRLIHHLRQELRHWLELHRLPAEAVREIILACSEACANAVEHSRHPKRQEIEIEAALHGSQLALRVRDFGT